MKRSTERDALRRANVVAVGRGFKNDTDQEAIVVSVTEKVSLADLHPTDVVPDTYEGLPTDVVKVGPIRAFSTSRQRPALGGDSVGHVDVTAGTLGCAVKRDGVRMILSNNHVIANENLARVGDEIIQPGAYDGGRSPADLIAHLEDFVPIAFDGGSVPPIPPIPPECGVGNLFANILNAGAWIFGRSTRVVTIREADGNLVDAAIARPVNDLDLSSQIRGIGFINSVSTPSLGMNLIKRGRTTDTTTGRVDQVDVTVRVQYGAGEFATFRDQVLAGPISQPGDSGSAVLDADNLALVGLLFAGSEEVTIINRIEHVFAALDLTL